MTKKQFDALVKKTIAKRSTWYAQTAKRRAFRMIRAAIVCLICTSPIALYAAAQGSTWAQVFYFYALAQPFVMLFPFSWWITYVCPKSMTNLTLEQYEAEKACSAQDESSFMKADDDWRRFNQSMDITNISGISSHDFQNRD